jgi:acyl-CoA synthetase (AMP-forming)/AMP-acid ligase II
MPPSPPPCTPIPQEAWRKADALASLLVTKHNLQKGDRVLLVYLPSLHFIVAFFACLKAGMIAVPVFPPDPRKKKNDLNMFPSIQRNCGAKIALTETSYNFAKKIGDIQRVFAKKGEYDWPSYIQWIVTDHVAVDPLVAENRLWPIPALTDIAFLQYTSGSTSEPKGVMITHGNLNSNLHMITKSLAASETTVVVSWLPQYHDMGLIGSYLGACHCGGSGVYMEPFTFVKNPNVWIRAISKYKATHLQAPNFAFALTARKFQALPDPHPPLAPNPSPLTLTLTLTLTLIRTLTLTLTRHQDPGKPSIFLPWSISSMPQSPWTVHPSTLLRQLSSRTDWTRRSSTRPMASPSTPCTCAIVGRSVCRYV